MSKEEEREKQKSATPRIVTREWAGAAAGRDVFDDKRTTDSKFCDCRKSPPTVWPLTGKS